MALRDGRDLSSSLGGSVQFILQVLTCLERGGLARQLQALVKIREVVLDNKDGVSEVVGLAQFFELFG